MGKFYKYLIILILLSGTGTLRAQQLRTAYFMDKTTMQATMNPALRPARGYIGLPVLGSFNITYASNKLAVGDLLYPRGGGLVTFLDNSVNAGSFLGGLRKNNQINADIYTDILSAGWYAGSGFWSINLSAHTTASSNVPKSLFEFIKDGTGPEGSVYNISDVRIHADAYAEIGVGYSRPVNDKITVGGKLKLLVGGGNVDMRFDHLTAEMNDNAWRITSSGQMNASVKGLRMLYDHDEEGDEYINDFELESPGIAGYGAAVDLGITYKPIKNLIVSGAVTDLGFISWSRNACRRAVADGVFDFKGFDLPIGDNEGNSMDDQVDQMTDDLEKLFHFTESGEEVPSRTTMLCATLNIGAEYSVARNRVGFGLLSSTRFYRPKAYTELTASVNYRPVHWFAASLSYSFIHSAFKTFGFALNFSPSAFNFFIGTDYMLGKVTKQFVPISARATNIHIGMSVPLGPQRFDCPRRYYKHHRR